YSYTDRGYELRHLESVSPGNRPTEGAIWNNYHIAGLEGRVHCTAAEHSALTADYRAISPDDENGFLVRHSGWAARLSQIPAGALTRLKGDRSWVVNCAVDSNEIWFLRDEQYVAGSNLHIGRRVCPAFHIAGYMNDHASCGRGILKFLQRVLPLQCSGFAGE